MKGGPGSDGWSQWPAPAKLNLFLHIVGRRSDGYHLLETVFQLLDWGDSVWLRPRDDGRIIRCGDNSGIDEASDLGVRAARALKQSVDGVGLGADIRIDKRIPIGGGLGGGSSDAATTLVALNWLWNAGLDEDRLAGIGLALGADVPVFVRGRTAYAEGIGEMLTAIDVPPRDYLVVDTGASVPTAALFADPQLTRDSPAVTIRGFVCGAPTHNAFEAIVRRRFAAVGRALDWLAAYGEPRLSGSGGAVFMPLREDGRKLLDACPSGMRAWIVRGVARSPLHGALAAAVARGAPAL